jgi:recombinational DNA repair protein RecR
MTTTVRALTEPEKDELGAMLLEIHAHVEGCPICQVATDKAGMCSVGSDNDRRWEQWLGGHR